PSKQRHSRSLPDQAPILNQRSGNERQSFSARCPRSLATLERTVPMHRFFPLAVLLYLGFTLATTQLTRAATIPGIDDKPISSWLWCNGCASDHGNTNATAGIAKVTQSGYTVDGQSVRFDLIKNCTSPCGYGNVFFYNNLAQNVSENSVTIDMYAMMDSAGN